MGEGVLEDRRPPHLSARPEENSAPLNMVPPRSPSPPMEGLILSTEAPHVILGRMSCSNNIESWGQHGNGKPGASKTGGRARLGTLTCTTLSIIQPL